MKRFLISMSLGAGAHGLALAGPGCAEPTYVRAGVAVGQPNLVWVEPGIWVVADSDWPIFYTDGYYWLYRDGYWYSSTYYWGGWVYAPLPRVPVIVARIDRPHRYLHYRPRPSQRRQPAPVPQRYQRDHRNRKIQPPPPRRDHRRNEAVPSRRNEKVPAKRGRPR